MINLKTYEGFFDFFKKKKVNEPNNVSIYDIRDCFYEIIDEPRIDIDLYTPNNRAVRSYINDFVFDKYLDLPVHEERKPILGFTLYKNILATNIYYDKTEIPDKEVTDILIECEDKLRSYGCVATYYINVRNDSQYADSHEYNNFNDLIKTLLMEVTDERIVIIKIKSKYDFKE